MDTEHMADFLQTLADDTDTSVEIIEACATLAQDLSDLQRIWEDPTPEEALAIWERVTKNGLRDAEEFYWGAAGTQWARNI